MTGPTVTERQRAYWLSTAARLRRNDDSLVFEMADGRRVPVPVTDVESVITAAPVDMNTATMSLLQRYGIDVHVLDHYGNYAGCVQAAAEHMSGDVVRGQVLAAENPERRMNIARALVEAAAFHARWVLGRDELDRAFRVLCSALAEASDVSQLMAAEGNFRRSCWALLDERLPDWLALEGRSRRPPRNAGNAFVSFVNSLVYARTTTAIRTTPLHPAIGFLHATTSRNRYTLALGLAEHFKPLFSERLLLRMAHRGELTESDLDQRTGAASLSERGRKKVLAAVRDELDSTIRHRSLHRHVRYDELLRFAALKLMCSVLEGERFKAFRVWW